MRAKRWMTVGTALLLVACNRGEGSKDEMTNAAVASGFRPPDGQAAVPLPGQAHTTPLTAYVGHYPRDAVDGVSFYDRTEVATALNDAVGDPIIRRAIRSDAGPQTPIFAAGGRIGSWGCEAHDCGDHNWALLVDPATGKGEVCYHDTAVAGGAARWYAGGASVTRPGDCPSGDAATKAQG